MTTSRWGRLGLWFAAFVVLAVVDAVQMRAGQRFEDFTITWGTALRRGFEAWIPSGVLGLGIVWLAGRVPFERERWGRWLGVHAVASVAFFLAFALIHAALLNGQRSVRGQILEFGTVFRKVLIFYSVTNLGFYWLVLLGHHGWSYYQRYRERERRAVELEGQLARARLEALRMQLNPHFLFNTLNTVVALVHDQPGTVERMVTRLGELLRASLDHRDAQEVPLGEEIRLLERYLDIEQVRFSDRLRVDLDVPEELRDVPVPSLVLQPLVENAIRHGIELLEAEGHIRVTARRHGNELRLVVWDNGPGPADNGGNEAAVRSGGIGLANTRARLSHLYGEAQRLELRRATDGGAEAVIHLPIQGAGTAVGSGRRTMGAVTP